MVLNKWQTDFNSLYEGHQEHNFDDCFYKDILTQKEKLEDDNNGELNVNITEQEVQKAISKAKNNKSAGIDNLPYEVFKNATSVSTLSALFQTIFTKGVLPTIWKQAIIKPIPKNAAIDPRIPLQYRGIALLSTTYK